MLKERFILFTERVFGEHLSIYACPPSPFDFEGGALDLGYTGFLILPFFKFSLTLLHSERPKL